MLSEIYRHLDSFNTAASRSAASAQANEVTNEPSS
jgi:hypothetical protein